MSDDGRVVWQVSMPPEQLQGNSVPSPVLINGIVVFAGADGLTALRAADGHRVWDYQVGHNGPLANAVSQLWQWDGNAVALIGYSATDWRVVAVDSATGDVRWQFKLTTPVAAQPGLSGDGVLALGTEKTIDAIDLSDGHLLWSRAVIPAAQRAYGIVQLAVTDGTVIVGYFVGDPDVRTGALAAFAEKTGAPLWSKTTGVPQIPGMQAADGTVLVWGESSDSGGTPQPTPLTALSAASGKTTWQLPVGIVYGVWTTPGRVIFGSHDGLYDVDPATGATRWRVAGEASAPLPGPSSLAITGSDILFYPYHPTLTDRSLANGAVAWTLPAVALGGGGTFVVTPDGPYAQVATSNNFDQAPHARVYTVDPHTGKLAAPVTELPSDIPAAPVVAGSDVIYQLNPEPCEYSSSPAPASR